MNGKIISQQQWIIIGLWLLWTAPAFAAGGTAAGENGRHDMLLLLPEGPVHLRVRITDDGRELQQIRQDYLQQLVATLDMDNDGRLSRDETAKHPLFVNGRRFDGNDFLESLRTRRFHSDRELELAVSRAAGQLLTYRQNNSLADQDLRVFGVLDADQSGLIERAEMRLAPARIAERDSDFDECVTFNEFLNDAPQSMPGLVAGAINVDPPAAVHSELLRDATEPILAARLVRHYDSDRDAHLTAGELGWTAERTAQLDADGDDRLSVQELSQIAHAPPDVWLEVDLSQQSSGAMRMRGDASPEVTAIRADLVRFSRGALTLNVGYRHREPIQEARQNASAAFNAIDIDANGYLDRDEIAEHQRFERYLFDAMDHDGDQRVFAEELLSYVEDYTEPASTTCQVTLLDIGNGFFQMLDQNADGRISIRDLRQSEQALLDAADAEPAINPSQLTKAYRIEIVRGGVSLFGRVDRPEADTPAALLRPPSGPMWFQRMDRNGDGDLSWDEFLGPRDVFHRIDSDRDDLIDEAEATRATKEPT